MVQASLIKKVVSWIMAHKQEAFVLALIIFIGMFLRLYRIADYMTFLGDEGRDVIVVRRLLLYADPILVGPGTSIGNMYLGPLYYYFIAPGLFLANYSPVGPAVQIALLGTFTIFFIWYVAREWFGKYAAVISSILYAVAPVVIVYSRSSWNPNIMPFFSLLVIYSLWKVYYQQKYIWLLTLGIAFAFVLQSHYLGLLLTPVIILFWLLALRNSRKLKDTKPLMLHTLLSGLGFVILMSPLVIFDARHEWRNFEAMKKFFTERQTTVSAKPWSSLPKTLPLLEKIITRVVAGYDQIVGKWTSLVLFAPLILLAGLIKKIKLNSKERKAHFLLLVWMGVALLGLGVYKQEIYDHYYGFIFAAPFLIIGGVGQSVINSSKFRGASVVIVGVALLVLVNLVNNPIKGLPNMQLRRTEKVAAAILEYSENKPFNLAVIAERNYDAAYRYYLDINNAKVVDIDPQKSEETTTEQLFVICEMEKSKCDPTHNPKAEVANFGWSKVENEWEVFGTTIYKLGHTK